MDVSPGAVLEFWDGDRYQVLTVHPALDAEGSALYTVRARALPSEWTRRVGAEPDPPGTEIEIPIIVDASGATFGRSGDRTYRGSVRTTGDVAAGTWRDLETGAPALMIDGWPYPDERPGLEPGDSAMICRFRAPGAW